MLGEGFRETWNGTVHRPEIRNFLGCLLVRSIVCFLGLGVMGAWHSGICDAQSSQGVADGYGKTEVEAIAGQPFGVARIRYPVEPGTVVAEQMAIQIKGLGGKVLYPAIRFDSEVVRSGPPLAVIPPGRGIGGGRLLGRITNIIRTVTSEEVSQVTAVEILFLFQGTDSFTVAYGDPAREVLIRPSLKPSHPGYPPLLARWWDAYTAGALSRLESAEYPPQVDAYTAGMLSRRLKLPIPAELIPSDDGMGEGIAPTIQLIGGSEELQGRLAREVSFGVASFSADTSSTFPQEPRWRERSEPGSVEKVDPKTEGAPELAQYVPRDSLYIRFGAFTHFLWFQRLTERFGGDIAQMVALRGLDRGISARNEELLNVRSSAMAQLLGPTVIEELAIVGSDLLLGDGPAIGVLFKPRNRFLLGTSLRNDRQSTLRSVPGAVLEDVEIGGLQVSYLWTPEGRVRSYLLETDQYFLVTSSKTLVEDFIKVLQGASPLANDPSFVAMRGRLPLDANTAISAYFSEGFLRRMAGPQYQIELRRRMRSVVEMQLVKMAELAADNEGVVVEGVDDLITQGYLPEGFGVRPEGGYYGVDQEGRIFDSARGSQGAFVPVVDMRISGVTSEEAEWYSQRAEFFSQQWSEMDPLVIQVNRNERAELPEELTESAQPRTSGAESIETIEIHAEIAPFVRQKYGWIAEQLGAPTRRMVQMPEDDIAWVQGYIDGDLLGTVLPPHHLFVGLKDDVLPNPRQLDGLLEKYFALKSLSGYLGAWPSPGLLDSLPLGLGQGREVSPGMSRLLIGLYRYTGGGFSLLSFSPEILDSLRTQLRPVEADDDSQLRFAVKNLKGSKIEPWVVAQLGELAAKGSRSGAMFLEALIVQLGVDPQKAIIHAAELLGGDLQCPLGGEYRLYAVEDAREVVWSSDFFGDKGPEVREQSGEILRAYKSPLLEWFRGGEGSVRQLSSGLEAEVTLHLAERAHLAR